MEIKNLIHTEEVLGKTRSFFIDLKKSVNGRNYLVITQSRKVDENNEENTRIFLFENEIAKFSEAMMRSLLKFTLANDEEREKYKEQVREKYPKAFSKWTDADEEMLKELFNEGYDIDRLAQNLQRNSGGIEARLKKLGLAQEEEKVVG